jgi:hypothetical protein
MYALQFYHVIFPHFQLVNGLGSDFPDKALSIHSQISVLVIIALFALSVNVLLIEPGRAVSGRQKVAGIESAQIYYCSATNAPANTV